MQLLVAADESGRLSEAVLPAILNLTGGAEPEITVLHVIHGQAEAWSAEELSHLASERRQTLEESLTAFPHQTRLLIEVLPYGDEIPSYLAARARDLKADAVIVSSKRATGIFSGILGSVAQGLLRASSIPVLVVRPPDS